MHKPLNHKLQSGEEPSLRRNKEQKLGSTLSQLSSPVHASLTQVILQRKRFFLWHVYHLWNTQGIRVWVQFSTSLVVQLHTSQVLRQSCNPTPPVDRQHLDTVTSLVIISNTVYIQKPERKKQNKKQPNKPLPDQLPGDLVHGSKSSRNHHAPRAAAKLLCLPHRKAVPVGETCLSAHGYHSRNRPGEPRGS